MERKYRRMIEGNLYVLSLPAGRDKASLDVAIDNELESAKCGQILGSGMSLVADGTIRFEIGAYDRDEANEAISRALRKIKCPDYELDWDGD